MQQQQQHIIKSCWTTLLIRAALLLLVTALLGAAAGQEAHGDAGSPNGPATDNLIASSPAMISHPQQLAFNVTTHGSPDGGERGSALAAGKDA
jgi:hypothetical protein